MQEVATAMQHVNNARCRSLPGTVMSTREKLFFKMHSTTAKDNLGRSPDTAAWAIYTFSEELM